MQVFDYVKLAAASVVGVLGYIFGPWDALLYALVVVMVLDYITGVVKGVVLRALSSEVGWRGLLKKLMILMLVGLGCMLDRLMNTNGAVRAAVAMFYIVNESLSILENVAAIGLPLPEVLKNTLAKLQQK